MDHLRSILRCSPKRAMGRNPVSDRGIAGDVRTRTRVAGCAKLPMPSHKPSGPASAAEPAAPVRVLIVDDHPAVRFGLRLLLEREGLTVAGEADCMAAARQLVATSRPDLAIVDLSLGDEDGLELLAELGRGEPRAGAAGLQHARGRRAHPAGPGRRGPGLLAKRESAAQLGEGLDVLAGAVYLSPRIAQSLAEARTSTCRQLSQKEQEIYELLGEGLGSSAIAARLDLSPRRWRAISPGCWPSWAWAAPGSAIVAGSLEPVDFVATRRGPSSRLAVRSRRWGPRPRVRADNPPGTSVRRRLAA